MHIGKESAADGTQRNPSKAKVHDLSCKIAPRDSSFTAKMDSCNRHRQIHQRGHQTGCYTEKAPLQECSLLTPDTLQQIPSPSTIQPNVLLQIALNKQRIKSLGQRDLNTHVGGIFRKGKCPNQKDLYPYLSSR